MSTMGLLASTLLLAALGFIKYYFLTYENLSENNVILCARLETFEQWTSISSFYLCAIFGFVFT